MLFEAYRSATGPRRSRAALAGGLLLALLLSSACTRVRFDGARLEKPGVTYRIGPLSAAWQRVEVEDNDLTFHRAGQGTVSVHATCQGYDDVPATALVNHLLFGTTHRQYVLEEEVTLDGRGAQHSIVDCELDGVPVRVEIYLLSRGGCVFDLSYISAPTAPGHAEFAGFVRAFRIEGTGRD